MASRICRMHEFQKRAGIHRTGIFRDFALFHLICTYSRTGEERDDICGWDRAILGIGCKRIWDNLSPLSRAYMSDRNSGSPKSNDALVIGDSSQSSVTARHKSFKNDVLILQTLSLANSVLVICRTEGRECVYESESESERQRWR